MAVAGWPPPCLWHAHTMWIAPVLWPSVTGWSAKLLYVFSGRFILVSPSALCSLSQTLDSVPPSTDILCLAPAATEPLPGICGSV